MLATFRERLVWLRSVCGAPTLREMSKIAELSHNHLAKLESGQRNDPDTTTVEALARAYGVTMDWLWKGAGPKPTIEQIRKSFERAKSKATAIEAAE